MNILNVTSIVEWRGGDAQMYTIYLLLKKHPEFNQYILCPNQSVLFEKGTKEGENIIGYQRKNKVFSLVKPIIKLVKKHNITVLHIHDSSALSAALLAKPFLPKNCKIIYSRKRNNPIKSGLSRKWKYNSPWIYKIVSVSKAVEQIYKDIDTPDSKLQTIYDAIDVKQFANKPKSHLIHKEMGWDVSTKIIGNVASLTDQKDLITFIETAEKIVEQENNVRFVIIGKGEKEDDLKTLVASKNLTEYIIFLGFKKNVADYLNEFDILLMTSISEGLPLVIYEAFASRVPIVSTNAGGIAEVVISGENGFVTPLKAVDQLANHCLSILNNDDLKRQFQEKSFELVNKQFDLKNLEENYYQFYKSIK